MNVTGAAGAVAAPARATVPGSLRVRVATGRLPEQDLSGFVTLTRGTDTRRVPFWFRVERPQLQRERQIPLSRPGTYTGDTSRGVARVSTYRYPELPPGDLAFPVRLSGRELVYRVHIRDPSFANLQAAYTLFTQYCLEHPAEVQKMVLSTSLEDFFSATRILRGILDAPKPDRQVYLTKVNDLAAKYDALVQRTTTTTAAQ